MNKNIGNRSWLESTAFEGIVLLFSLNHVLPLMHSFIFFINVAQTAGGESESIREIQLRKLIFFLNEKLYAFPNFAPTLTLTGFVQAHFECFYFIDANSIFFNNVTNYQENCYKKRENCEKKSHFLSSLEAQLRCERCRAKT